MNQLSRSHVLVFGGSSGIGLAIAEAALTRGATVTIAARDAARLAAAAGALAAPTPECQQREPQGDARLFTAIADITSEAAVARVIEQRPVDHAWLSTIDASYGPVRQLDLAAARRALDTKLSGALHLAKHLRLPAHGSLTLISGIAADRPAPGGSVVAAMNGALHSLVRALAIELAPARVNALSPGWVDTPAWDRIAGDDKERRLAERGRSLPVGRVGRPTDIAHAAIFLMESAYTTGEVLHVDGGHRLV